MGPIYYIKDFIIQVVSPGCEILTCNNNNHYIQSLRLNARVKSPVYPFNLPTTSGFNIERARIE